MYVYLLWSSFTTRVINQTIELFDSDKWLYRKSDPFNQSSHGSLHLNDSMWREAKWKLRGNRTSQSSCHLKGKIRYALIYYHISHILLKKLKLVGWNKRLLTLIISWGSPKALTVRSFIQTKFRCYSFVLVSLICSIYTSIQHEKHTAHSSGHFCKLTPILSAQPLSM